MLELPKPGEITIPENIPAELRAIRSWVVWRPGYRADGTIAKKPHDWRNPFGVPVAPGDPQYWCSFDQAVATMHGDPTGYTGIGVYLTPEANLCCFDEDVPSDVVRNTLGVMHSRVPSWAEGTVSGNTHSFWRGQLPHGLKSYAAPSGGMQVFAHDQFIAILGIPVAPDHPIAAYSNGHIADADADIKEMFAFLDRKVSSTAQTGEWPLAAIAELLSHADPSCDMKTWLNIIYGVWKETGGADEAFALINDWSSRSIEKYDFKEVRRLWYKAKPGGASIATLVSVVKAAVGGAGVSAIMRKHGVRQQDNSVARSMTFSAPSSGEGVTPGNVRSIADIKAEIWQRMNDLRRDSTVLDVQAIMELIVQLRPSTALVEQYIERFRELGHPCCRIAIVRKMHGEAEAAYRNALRAADGLQRDSFGAIRNNMRNTLHMLRTQHPDLVKLFQWDEFMLQVMVTRRPPWHDAYPWETAGRHRQLIESDLIGCVEALQNAGLSSISVEIVHAAIGAVAHENKVNVMRDSFGALVWDSVPRIDKWLIDFAGAEDSACVRAIGAKWLIGVCARVFDPGCQFDNVLCFEGPQGAGKTSLLRALAGSPDFYCSFTGDMHEKDNLMKLRGKLICEFAEGISIRKSAQDEQKEFISRTHDEYRDPYARLVKSWPRQFGWAYTGNNSEYLNDATGSRRMWPFMCDGRMHVEAFKQELPQLWAEAVARYRAGERWWIDSQVETDLVVEHANEIASRQVENPWSDLIRDWLEYRDGSNKQIKRPYGMVRYVKNMNVVVTQAIPGMSIGKVDNKHLYAAADVMQKLGYVKRPVRTGGVKDPQVNGYFRNDMDVSEKKIVALIALEDSKNVVE